MRYGHLENGIPVFAECSVKLNGRIIAHPTAEDYALIGELPIVDTPPTEPAPKGYHWEASSWDDSSGKEIGRIFIAVADPLPTLAEYDAAMEAHLRAEREARGYTTREPDSYTNSSVPRWKQDAVDWVAHRDAVMEYALTLINEVAAGMRPQPTMEEFLAGLPVIAWTFEQ